ncbi:MAG: hypothetical protein KatS3mg077_2254 [Candidatus Binatia bacterium]|nr:MAG: hypothetical protein KatS3mg077_2254 [Candidatus Binatia bacterium]
MDRQTLTVAEHAPRFASVPCVPGVYVFQDSAGNPLYVGKSKQLRRRLQSYFCRRGSERRKATMVQLFATTVSLELAGSDFAAMLRELELVHELRPRFNQRMRYPERYAYIAIDFRLPYPRLRLTTEPDSHSVFLGPFAARSRMRAAVQEISDAFSLRTCSDPMPSAAEGRSCWRYHVRTCCAPCQGKVSSGTYGRALLQAVRTLTGSSHALRQWRAQRAELVEQLAFERAHRLLQRELRVQAAQRLLFLAVRRGDDAVVIQPSVNPDCVCLWAIRSGDIASHIEIPHAELAAGIERLWAVYSEPAPQARFLPQADIDRRWIIYRWLRSDEGRAWSIPIRGRSLSTVRSELHALARRLPRALMPSAPALAGASGA